VKEVKCLISNSYELFYQLTFKITEMGATIIIIIIAIVASIAFVEWIEDMDNGKKYW
jgi:hypothetical protein